MPLPIGRGHRHNSRLGEPVEDGDCLVEMTAGAHSAATHNSHHARERSAWAERASRGRKSGHSTAENGDDSFEDSLSPHDRRFATSTAEPSNLQGFSWAARRYALLFVPGGLLLSIPMIVTGTAGWDAMVGKERLFWLFTWLELSWACLWSGIVLMSFVPAAYRCVMAHVNPSFRKYWTCLKCLSFPAALIWWGVSSLIMFDAVVTSNSNMADGNRSDWQNTVLGIMAILTVWAVLVFILKVLVMVLRIHYQKRSLVANISQSKEKVWALSILYDASRALQLPFCPSLKAQDAVVGASNHPVDEGVGHAPARTMHRIGRLVDRLIGAYGAMISRASKPHWFQPNSSHAVVIKALESQASSEALARRLWASLVREGQNTLVLDDFLRTFGSDRGKDADRCFRTFDENRNGDLLQDEMVMAVAEVGRMRRANIQGLDDMDYAMRSFDYMLQTVVALVVMLWVVIEYAPIAKNVIDVFQYAVVGVSFAMGRTVHEFVACSMYIFLKHPYDVGDRVELWNLHTNSLIPLVVQRVSLLYTVFKRVDNYKLFQSSNFVLNALSLENISRSGANKEQISFVVDFDTTFKDLSQLRDELQAFVSHPENRRDYNPDITVDIAGIHEMASLELRVELQYKTNWSNGPLRIARRAKFMCALVAIARRIPIARPGGYFPAGTEKNPQYVVQVSETQAGIQRGVIDRELREMRGDFSPETDGNEGGKKEEEAWWEAETQPSERSTTTIGAPDSEEAAAMLSMMGNLILPAPSLENPPRIGMTLQRRKKSGPVSLGGMSTSINTETTSA